MSEDQRSLPNLSIDAFCISTEGTSLLTGLRQHERGRRSAFRIHESGLLGAIDFYARAESPDLIIVEHDAQDDLLFESLDRLALRCNARTHLLLIGPANDIRFYQRLISFGVSEYIALPASDDEVLNAILRVFGSKQDISQGRVVSVIGATGGCGSSTLTRVLAQLTGAQHGKPSILIDLDGAFGSAGFALGLDPDESYAQAIQTPGRMDTVLLERLLRPVGSDLRFLISPSLTYLTETSYAELERILLAARQVAPFVFIDLPHGWTRQTERALSLSDDIVVVSPPTLLGLRNLKLMGPRLPTTPHLVLSPCGMRGREEIDASRFEQTSGMKPLCHVPFDPRFFTNAESEGRLLFKNANQRKAKFLLPVLDKLSPTKKSKGMSFPFLNFLKRA